MKSKYFKEVCVFVIAFSTPILLSCIYEATPYPLERVGSVVVLLMFGVASLGIGMLYGEDEK